MKYKYIIVPLDGSELAESVFPHLEAITSNENKPTVELVRVAPQVELHFKAAVPFEAKEEQELNQSAIKESQDYLERVKGRLSSSGINITTKILIGNVADALIEHINNSGADIVLLATHGRSGPSRWIWGSIADKLLHSCEIPILLVRPQSCHRKS